MEKLPFQNSEEILQKLTNANNSVTNQRQSLANKYDQMESLMNNLTISDESSLKTFSILKQEMETYSQIVQQLNGMKFTITDNKRFEYFVSALTNMKNMVMERDYISAITDLMIMIEEKTKIIAEFINQFVEKDLMDRNNVG